MSRGENNLGWCDFVPIFGLKVIKSQNLTKSDRIKRFKTDKWNDLGVISKSHYYCLFGRHNTSSCGIYHHNDYSHSSIEYYRWLKWKFHKNLIACEKNNWKKSFSFVFFFEICMGIGDIIVIKNLAIYIIFYDELLIKLSNDWMIDIM